MEVQLGEYILPLEIIRKNNKNIYFRFKDKNTLYVTCNRFISEKEVRRLIKKNEKSLLKMYQNYQDSNNKSNIFYYLGKPYTIVYDNNLKNIQIDKDMIFIKDETSLNKWLKKECQRVFTEEINKLLSSFTHIPPFKLRIRKMKTRWGVNNVSKNIITLNSELIRKPPHLIDYVIVHELCHFYEANHSSRFWYQVSLRYPNYKQARKELRY